MASSSSQSPASPVEDQHGEHLPVRTKRRYGASCELCRRRKRKCPGRDSNGNSLCTHCGEVGVKCVFPPNGSFLRARKAVAAVGALPEVDTLRAYINHLASSSDDERDRMLNQWMDEHGLANPKDTLRKLPHKLNPRSSRSNGFEFDEDEDGEHKLSLTGDTMGRSHRPFKKPRLWPENIGNAKDVGDDEGDGQSAEKSLRPESALRLSLKPATPDDSESTGEDEPPVDRSIQSSTALQANISAWVDRWIATSFPTGITTEGPNQADRKLLFDNYFCWQGPRNGIVHRGIFERALEENDSKYYSPFLLYAICAHTVRHIPQLRDRVHEYAAKAHYLLAVELSRPSSIPTVQGLMLLASHDAARGMYAQAWNLSSTAIAMMMDLGCHLDKIPSVTVDRNDPQREQRIATQRQMRSRVFWSAFIWDKLISLALNRTPLLNAEEHTPPFPEPTDSSDLWVPVLCADSPPSLFSYVPQPSHEMKCFYESCRANQFLDQIHRHLYRTQKLRSPEAREFVAEMRDRMLAWQEEACSEVLLDLSSPLDHSPPPHIMQLNLLVRLMWILLYRPFFYSSDQAPSVPDAVPTCARAAIEINRIFTMYDRYYPLSRASYIVIFAGFLQATVDLALADREKIVDGPTLSRLALAGRVLSGGSANIPGMHSSVRCLQEHLHATLSRCARKATDQLLPRTTSVVSTCAPPPKEFQSMSPSPPLLNHHSLHSDAHSDSSTMTSFSVSPISTVPVTHDIEESELTPLTPPYAMLSHPHPSGTMPDPTRHLSPSEMTPYNNLDIPQREPSSYEMDSLYRSATSYIPQTPDQEVVDYMIGPQISHYESGWNAWFWPGDHGGSIVYNGQAS
ncbi:fungal-specific transcription factor domain-containing protein [Lentinula raphanica]|uniref:Fungal-specific transcription factor domain-containing protein n=1 Tax=Lentinula raphanica TaxID=153919 RepID=A0AA38UHK0_9AGAR|nr:fungal-specific transcription factor domain-containing protein [Lentinula raphanica]KAJ3975216.1 fungal-specific transcription factor domain-containing protein [Lentinula raphanica]